MTLEELVESGRITEEELRELWQKDVKRWTVEGHPEGKVSFDTWLYASGWLDED